VVLVENKDVIVELKRELLMREKLYPGWVRDGKLSQKTADRRILAMVRAIELIESMDIDQPVDGQLNFLDAI